MHRRLGSVVVANEARAAGQSTGQTAHNLIGPIATRTKVDGGVLQFVSLAADGERRGEWGLHWFVRKKLEAHRYERRPSAELDGHCLSVH